MRRLDRDNGREHDSHPSFRCRRRPRGVVGGAHRVRAGQRPGLARRRQGRNPRRREGRQARSRGGGRRPGDQLGRAGPSTTRAERKAATLKARKDGELQPPGPTQKGDLAMQKQPSTKTRDERKAETLEAKKKGELVPAGEGPRK